MAFRSLKRLASLIKPLLTVGIIAAVIAVAPAVVKKASAIGRQGAMAAETRHVQTAMHAMMAEHGIATVKAKVNPAAATNDWSAFPAGPGSAALFGASRARYLQSQTTTFYYCWTGDGDVYTRHADPEIADDPGPCRPPP